MQFPDNYQQQKIEKLIKALGIDLEFTGKEIAEILNSFILLKSSEKIKFIPLAPPFPRVAGGVNEVRSQKSEVRSYFCNGYFEQLSKNITP